MTGRAFGGTDSGTVGMDEIKFREEPKWHFNGR